MARKKRWIDLAKVDAGTVIHVRVGITSYWLTPIIRELRAVDNTAVRGIALHIGDSRATATAPVRTTLSRIVHIGQKLYVGHGDARHKLSPHNVESFEVLAPPTAPYMSARPRQHPKGGVDLLALAPGDVVGLCGSEEWRWFITATNQLWGNDHWVRGVVLQPYEGQATPVAPWDLFLTRNIAPGNSIHQDPPQTPLGFLMSDLTKVSLNGVEL